MSVCVVQLISMADSRTERLCLLLTACNSIAHTYFIQPLLISAGFPENKRHPLVVAAQKCAAKK